MSIARLHPTRPAASWSQDWGRPFVPFGKHEGLPIEEVPSDVRALPGRPVGD